MKVLILEDEARVANQLKKLVETILKGGDYAIRVCFELEDAISLIDQEQIDLLLLDLNLNGEDGFEILKRFSAESFHTIITSSYKNKAIEAFEYGVLDFVPKPFELERMKKAFSRIEKNQVAKNPARYLVLKKSLFNQVVAIEEVYFIEAQGHHSILGLKNGRKETHHKSLGKLLKILPHHFKQVHRSFAVNTQVMEQINSFEGSKYELLLRNGFKVPIGRKFYSTFKEYFI